MTELKLITSTNEAERVAKLGVYFRVFLSGWVEQLAHGVSYSPEVIRELAHAFIEQAAMALIATSDSADKEADDETAERCKRAALAAFAVIEKEVLS